MLQHKLTKLVLFWAAVIVVVIAIALIVRDDLKSIETISSKEAIKEIESRAKIAITSKTINERSKEAVLDKEIEDASKGGDLNARQDHDNTKSLRQRAQKRDISSRDPTRKAQISRSRKLALNRSKSSEHFEDKLSRTL